MRAGSGRSHTRGESLNSGGAITNSRRPHSALGYLTPEEYVQGLSFALLCADAAERFRSQGNPSGSLTRGLDFFQALPAEAEIRTKERSDVGPSGAGFS